MKNKGKDLQGGRYLRQRERQLGFIEDKTKIWKEHMEKILNDENKWCHMVKTDTVEGHVEKAICEGTVKGMQKLKTEKATNHCKCMCR